MQRYVDGLVARRVAQGRRGAGISSRGVFEGQTLADILGCRYPLPYFMHVEIESIPSIYFLHSELELL